MAVRRNAAAGFFGGGDAAPPGHTDLMVSPESIDAFLETEEVKWEHTQDATPRPEHYTPPPVAPKAPIQRVQVPRKVVPKAMVHPDPPDVPWTPYPAPVRGKPVDVPITYDQHVMIANTWSPIQMTDQLRKMAGMHRAWGWSYNFLLAAGMIERLYTALEVIADGNVDAVALAKEELGRDREEQISRDALSSAVHTSRDDTVGHSSGA